MWRDRGIVVFVDTGCHSNCSTAYPQFAHWPPTSSSSVFRKFPSPPTIVVVIHRRRLLRTTWHVAVLRIHLRTAGGESPGCCRGRAIIPHLGRIPEMVRVITDINHTCLLVKWNGSSATGQRSPGTDMFSERSPTFGRALPTTGS